MLFIHQFHNLCGQTPYAGPAQCHATQPAGSASAVYPSVPQFMRSQMPYAGPVWCHATQPAGSASAVYPSVPQFMRSQMPYAGPAQCHATQPAGPASAVHLPMQKQFPQLFHNEPNRNNDIGVRVFGSSNAEQLEMAKLFNDIIEATPEKRETMTLEKWEN